MHVSMCGCFWYVSSFCAFEMEASADYTGFISFASALMILLLWRPRDTVIVLQIPSHGQVVLQIVLHIPNYGQLATNKTHQWKTKP